MVNKICHTLSSSFSLSFFSLPLSLYTETQPSSFLLFIPLLSLFISLHINLFIVFLPTSLYLFFSYCWPLFSLKKKKKKKKLISCFSLHLYLQTHHFNSFYSYNFYLIKHHYLLLLEYPRPFFCYLNGSDKGHTLSQLNYHHDFNFECDI